jgi:phosphate transport system substrate-binding protein
LLPKRPQQKDLAIEALKFFDWSFAKGGATAEALDYVSPAPGVVAAIRKSWSENLQEAQGALSLS